MTSTTSDSAPARIITDGKPVQAHAAGFWRDFTAVAGRALRGATREPAQFIPAMIIPLFFFAVNVGALQDVSQVAGIADYKAFQLPVAIIIAVTGVSSAPRLVTDIASGYFDRLLVSPVKRPALLLGLMAADVVLVAALTLPVLIVGFLVGVRFESGLLGVLMFIGMAALWGLALTGLPYTIALRTGSPSAVASSFVIFFPFLFLTTTFLPQDALTGWLATVAEFNPVTYVLAGLRSLITPGWVAADLIAGFTAIGILGVISFTLALLALRARTRRR
ncbi:MAG: ABC transporter permease [Nakamurella sp.]